MITKLVNGVEVALSDDELTERSTEVAAATAAMQQRQAEADKKEATVTAIKNFSLGGKTLADIKAMDEDEFNSFWTANVKSLADASQILKIVTRSLLLKV